MTTNLVPNTVTVNLFGTATSFMKSIKASPEQKVYLDFVSSTVTRTSGKRKYWVISLVFRSYGSEGREMLTHEVFDNPTDVAILESITEKTPITVTPVFTRPVGYSHEELTLKVTVHAPTEITGTPETVGNGKGTVGEYLRNI